MKATYPVSLDLTNKQIVIIGGGKIAERKINGLLNSGAMITLISPEVTAGLQNLAEEKRLVWKKRCFEPGDLTAAFLIIAATNNSDTNLAVKKASSENQLILLVDSPEQSNFQIPAIVRRGRLTVSISTSGASPLLAKKIRQQLEESFDTSYEAYLDFLFEARQKILSMTDEPKRKRLLLEMILSEDFRESSNRWNEFMHLLNTFQDKDIFTGDKQ